ncbi:hypothetical protein Tco_1400569 [Tanacetum coccineum]
MGDENPIRTLGDYFKPNYEGYRNTIELPEGNNVVPLRSDTIRLVQNGCSFHGLRSEDPNSNTSEGLFLITRLTHLTLTVTLGNISREGLQTCNELIMFQSNQRRVSFLEVDRFKIFTPKVPHHGIDLWLQVQIFYDRIDKDLKKTVDYATKGQLRKLSAEKAWATIEKLAQYEMEGWNESVSQKMGALATIITT